MQNHRKKCILLIESLSLTNGKCCMTIQHQQEVNPHEVLGKLKLYRKKLRYLRYPSAILYYLLPANSPSKNFIRGFRHGLKFIKYILYIMIVLLYIYIKIYKKD